MKTTEINQAGLELIKKMEGFRAKPYLCPAKIATVGYGTTRYPDGRRVGINDDAVSKATAEYYLRFDVAKFAKYVDEYSRDDLNENQFSALVSFCYNVGPSALRSSTLLKIVNANPNAAEIKRQFMRWRFAGGRELNGLIKRRELEAELYFTPVKNS